MKTSLLSPLFALVQICLLTADARACPMCLSGAPLDISAQPLVYAQRSVLAMPSADGKSFRVVEVIKGETPVGEIIEDHVYRALTSNVRGSGKTLLLIREDTWGRWVNFGAIDSRQAPVLRKFAATKRSTEFTEAEWAAHVAYFQPYLQSSEPMLAKIAAEELASAKAATEKASK